MNLVSYPPYGCLINCLEKCPNMVQTYLWLWKFRRSNDDISIAKEVVRAEHSNDLKEFSRTLQRLQDEDLILHSETMFFFHIHFQKQEINAAGLPLC